MLPDPKEFDKFLKICRKHRLEELKIGDISIKFGAVQEVHADLQEEYMPHEPTPDELIFAAVQG